MLQTLRPCSWRALALAVLALLAPRQEQGLPAAAARTRSSSRGTFGARRNSGDPEDLGVGAQDEADGDEDPFGAGVQNEVKEGEEDPFLPEPAQPPPEAVGFAAEEPQDPLLPEPAQPPPDAVGFAAEEPQDPPLPSEQPASDLAEDSVSGGAGEVGGAQQTFNSSQTSNSPQTSNSSQSQQPSSYLAADIVPEVTDEVGGAQEALEQPSNSTQRPQDPSGWDAAAAARDREAAYNASLERNLRRLSMVKDALSDMLTNIDKEGEEEAANFVAFNQWCHSEIGGFQHLLAQASQNRDVNAVAEKELQARISQLNGDLTASREEAQNIQDELEQKQRLDAEEEQKYDRDLTLNQQSISQLEKAVMIAGSVQSQGGFLQNGVLTRLQLNEPGESSYVLGIMKRLRTSLQATRTQLQSTRQNHSEQAQQFQSTQQEQLQELTTETTGGKDQLTQARVDLVEVQRDLAYAQEKIPEVAERLEQTQAHCDAKNLAWKARQQDRRDEKDAITEAIMALGVTVMDPLEQNQTSLGAAGSVAGDVSELPQEPPQPLEAAQGQPPTEPVGGAFIAKHRQSIVRGRSANLAMPVLTQVASSRNRGSAAAGSLAYVSAMLRSRSGDEVKKVVTDLLAQLRSEQQQEDELVAECTASLATKDGEQSNNQDRINQLNASIRLKTATIQTTSLEVEDLRRTLQGLELSLENATELRRQEHNMYQAQTSDRKLSLKVLGQARQVLQRFYKSEDYTALVHMRQRSQRVRQRQALAAQLQLGEDAPSDAEQAGRPSSRDLFANMSSSAPPPTWTGNRTKEKIQGYGVLALLERLKDDITAEQRTADTEEQEGVTGLEQLRRDTRSQTDDAMAEVTERMKRKARLGVEMNSDREDHAAAVEELGSVEQQIQTLHERCDEIMANLQERTRARAFEVGQLRDVLDILAGSQLAVRTGIARPEAPEAVTTPTEAPAVLGGA